MRTSKKVSKLAWLDGSLGGSALALLCGGAVVGLAAVFIEPTFHRLAAALGGH